VRLLVELHVQVDVSGLDGLLHRIDRRLDDRGQIDRPHVQAELPRDDARHVEQVLDELVLRLGVALDDL
jgi:hypothetical protein